MDADELARREYYFLLRRRKNITLQQLAEQIGCHLSLLSKYEKGKCNLSLEKEHRYKMLLDWGNKQ